MTRPLAIIESDTVRSRELCDALEAGGFRTEAFSSATVALPHLRTRSYALALLGLELRDTDPYSVCRDVSPHLPVITMAGACAGSDACVHALECGADDCVPRTISGRELIARIRSVLRRTAPKNDENAVTVSLSEMRVRAGKTVHNLSRGETALLAVLLQHAPTPVAITRLVQLLGARRSTIETQIKSLRRKLGPGRLVSRPKLGYQWVGD